ncbi:lysosomal alpha-mannosidase [Centruroides vittatus]|uniref:lysosomal alpha-mannosidase n=1 Tax=Centruroides vittatus TaxID=120091 RepID=UPI00350F0034
MLLYLIFFLFLSFESSTGDCGYESCPAGDPDMLNVHIICHTHNDVGWLKTVDQYYYGAKTDIQRAGVQYILDSVVDSLLKKPERKFIYVETAFFWRWWKEQDDHVRNSMRKLIMSGQLEFISGGWCMNDEGAAHYNAIIDQMTLGFKRLKGAFGNCGIPHIGWQIDPFGHSAEQASLFAQMGFDGYFLGRIDFQDKMRRESMKQMEFIWKASQNIGKEGTIFTSILPNTYSPPAGFCFDILCNDQPIMDDPRMEDYNVNERVEEFIKIIMNEAKNYRTNHIIMTMGNDFNYQYAESWFKNLDKLMYYVNQQQKHGRKINVFYSTPSCYLKAVQKKNETWKIKTDDFFPYASDPHAFWTGYFTSRPSVKGYFRLANNILQVGKQLFANAGLTQEEHLELTKLSEALGVAQHHDAISGTAKQAVTDDYVKQVAQGIDSCQSVINKAYKKIMPISSAPAPDQIFCNYLNISECAVTENSNLIAVTIYNPIAKNISNYVRLPVKLSGYQVTDFQDHSVDSQLIPISKNVINIPGRKSNATHELVFKVNLPPLGYSTYFVNKTNNATLLRRQLSKKYYSNGGQIVLKNNHFALYFSKQGGLKYAITKEGIHLPINQSYYWYRAMNGNNSKINFRASGAYIFRPNGTEPYIFNETSSAHAYLGPIVKEIHQTFSSWITQVIRIYKDEEYVEFDWVIGPIPVNDSIGKEVITRFHSDLNSTAFYTDANGREIKERILNYRPTWNLNLSEPVSGNYYPINSRIYIQDKSKNIQLTILNDRSQGGSSLKSGSVELMIHRRLLHDDAFGVGEALNELGVDGRGLVVKGKHYLILSDINSAASKHRALAEKLFMAPLLSFATIKSQSVAKYMSNFHSQASFLSKPLPPNVHLLTLEPWNGKILLRLEHMFESFEDPKNMSKSVNVSLTNLFKNFNLISMQEMTLGANNYKNNSSSMHWNILDSFKKHPEKEGYKWKNNCKAFNIVLNPMQIRTFELTISR